jgi:hypothetical protein
LRRRLQTLGEVDVVHGLAGAVDVAIAQEVAQTQVERIQSEPLREQVDRPLARPRRLHLAVAAKRARGR